MQAQPAGWRPLSPVAAAFLGLLFPGGGHIYCGQRQKGTLILVVGIFTGFLCGLMNLWACWASWRLAAQLKFAPPLRGGRGSSLEFLGDVFD